METQKICCIKSECPEGLLSEWEQLNEGGGRFRERMKSEIIKLIEEYGVCGFITGMSTGDLCAAEIVLELKAKYPHITLECAIPYENQAEKWSEPMRDRYFSIIERCDRETLLRTQYIPGCVQRGDGYMVKNSDYILAAWSSSLPESSNTLWLARMAVKEAIAVNPETM